VNAYLIGVAFFLASWTLLYAAAPRSRWLMLCASLGFAHVGPLLEHWYLRDYWRPTYIWSVKIGGLMVAGEDYLFGFAVAGVAAGLFGLSDSGHAKQLVHRSTWQIWGRLQVPAVLFLLSMSVLIEFLHLNSMYATLVSCFAGCAWVSSRDSNWLRRGSCAGCSMAFLFWVLYELLVLRLYPSIFYDWWNQSALSGIKLGSVPVEELAWGFAMGLFIGPVVRVCSAPAPRRDHVVESPGLDVARNIRRFT
jgi:Lycopene cyclase